ncbi:MAG: hypothetical protein GY694_10980 [Gammaproteobacteria bacterium]|nr:hypothetical protein [Gammaproteobacteria bacterium]
MKFISSNKIMESNTMQTKLTVLALMALLLTGCGGGGADVKTTTNNTTMGQELMDLNESYKKGILTEKEYKNAKENIMDRYDN